MDEDLFDDGFVQEDEDDSSDDELQQNIAEKHNQFLTEQTIRQEALRTSRSWSAPPLMSPRPETQRAKKAEAEAQADKPTALIDATTQPRSEYQPPAERSGFTGSELPDSMRHLAPMRPQSAGHLRTPPSGVGGTPLQDILEESPLDLTTTRSLTTPSPSKQAPQPTDTGAQWPVSEEPSGVDSVPDEALYDEVGDSISQAASRHHSMGGALAMPTPLGHRTAAHDSGSEEEDEVIEDETSPAPDKQTTETDRPAPEPHSNQLASPSARSTTSPARPLHAAVRVPTTVLPQPPETAQETASASASESAGDSASESKAATEHSEPSTASVMTDYGDLLHPHTFALQLLKHDVTAPVPSKSKKARRPRGGHQPPAKEAAQPTAPQPTPVPARGTPVKTAGAAPTEGLQQIAEEDGAADLGATLDDRSPTLDTHPATLDATTGQATYADQDYGNLLHPHEFAIMLIDHDVLSTQDKAASPRRSGSPDSRRPAGTHAPTQRRRSQTRGPRDPLARHSAGLMTRSRAGQRPVSAPSQADLTSPVQPAAWAEDAPAPDIQGTPSGRQQGLQQAMSLVSDDEADVEVLPVHGDDEEGVLKSDSPPPAWAHDPDAYASTGPGSRQQHRHHGVKGGNTATGITMSFNEWERAFRGTSMDGAVAEVVQARPVGKGQKARGTRPQTAPSSGRAAPMRMPHSGVPASKAAAGPGWAYTLQSPGTDAAWGTPGILAGLRTSRQRPATAHPLSRSPPCLACPQPPYLPTTPTVQHALCSTASVDVAGHQVVSVYVADTLRKVADANRCLAVLGLTQRYRLKHRSSNMQLEMWDSRWRPAEDVHHGDEPSAQWLEMMAPATKQLTLSAFLTAHGRLRQQLAQLEELDDMVQEPRMVVRPSVASGPRVRPKSAAAAFTSPSPYKRAGGEGARKVSPGSGHARQRHGGIVSGIPGIPVGGFAMPPGPRTVAGQGLLRRNLSNPHWEWQHGHPGVAAQGGWATDHGAATGAAAQLVPDAGAVMGELEARLECCDVYVARIGQLQSEQLRAARGRVI